MGCFQMELGWRFGRAIAVAIGLWVAAHAHSVSAAWTTGIGEPQRSAPSEVELLLDGTAAGPGKLFVTVTVIPSPNIGDLRGVYFHIADESLLDGLSVTGPDVNDFEVAANSVRRLANDNWINPWGDFDLGINIGTPGIEDDDIQTTSFVLAHATEPLTVQQFEFQEFGVRLNHVGLPGGRRSHLTYSKLTGTLPQAIPEPSSPLAIALGALMCLARTRRGDKPSPIENGKVSRSRPQLP